MKSDIKKKAEKIREELRYIYGVRVEIRIGASEKCPFDIEENANITDIVAYFRTDLDVAIVWNQAHRKDRGSKSHCFSWNQPINHKSISEGYIDVEHKYFRAADGLESECVLIMSLDTLQKNTYDLFDLLQNASMQVSDEEGSQKREKRTVEQYNRSAKFRNEVLTMYGEQCAVCGCTEEKILQAAHIRAVAEGGSDDPKNGICLCANHHLMFDHDLIRIDLKKSRVYHIADSVKQMAWYEQAEKRDFRLFLPEEEN